MKKLILIALIFTLSISSCSQKSNGAKSIEQLEIPTMEQDEMSETATATDEASLKSERKLIKKGNLRFQTDDIKETTNIIQAIAKKYRAYIALDISHDYSYNSTHELQIRVPAKDFDNMIADIAQQVEKFDDKSINTTDVSKEFIDVQARIKTKKALVKRYLELLKKAKKVSEMLEIENEIARQQSQIESAEGQLNYLKSQTTYASLNINYYTKTKDIPKKTFLDKTIESLQSGLKILKQLFLVLITLWPFIILTPIIIYFVKRKSRKNKKNNPKA